MAAVVPDVDGLVNFVGLIDGVDGILIFPETGSVRGAVFMQAGEGGDCLEAYCSMETLFPSPPNSPWKPIRVGS